MRPTILYDKQIFKFQQFGGISRYFSILMDGLAHSYKCKILPNNYFSNNSHLNRRQLNKFSFLYQTRKFKGKNRLINFMNSKDDRNIKRFIEQGKYDIFHPTYYEVDFLDYMPINKSFVLTVYDMIHEKMPELIFDNYNEVMNKSLLIRKAKHIIAISENTKKDIIHFYPEIDSQKITVIHLACSQGFQSEIQISSHLSNYILFVGNRGFYKNFNWMFQSISHFLKEKNMILVCAGGGNFSDSEIELFKSVDLDEKVLFIDISNDNILNELYTNAFCFIFPSLYEGFGIPILEAFSSNCPVILSKASCFPEVAENAALYFELYKPDTLVEQLNNLYSNKNLRYELINKSKDILLKYSWEKMVSEHMVVYNSILKKS